ncbi:MAG: two component system response regulator [Pseudobdellovibrio sp.]|jgi:DNA-binding response OmpR family regulator|nr:two component system response regulator [Pseudobdellovibrio sp.]
MNFNSRHIVLVEDEVALGEICCELLNANGFKTTLYTNAAEALAGIKDSELDLLVTDVGLTDRSGYDLATEVNARMRASGKAEVPVLFVSGGFLPKNSAKTQTYYLEKPFSIYTLVKQVKEVFDSQVPSKQAG